MASPPAVSWLRLLILLPAAALLAALGGVPGQSAVVLSTGGTASFYSSWYRPAVTEELPAWLAANGTISASGNAVVGASMSGSAARVWVYTGNGGDSDLSAKLDASLLESATRISNTVFQARYQATGGRNGVFNFPASGTHTWSYRGEQLQAMLPDLQRVLGGGPRRVPGFSGSVAAAGARTRVEI